MPVYRNTSNTPATYGGMSFPSWEDVPTAFYVPESATMQKISDQPGVKSPLLLYKNVTDETVVLPYCDDITVSVVTDTSAFVKFADDDCQVQVTSSRDYTLSAPWNQIGRITVTGNATIAVERRG